MRVAVLASLLVLGCAAPRPSGISNTAGATVREIEVYGTVRDYAGRPVADAFVRASYGNEPSLTVTTDRDGRFTIRIRPGGRLTATQDDLLGSVEVRAGDHQIDIAMAQMPQ
jgi:hypothetical protein